MRSFWLPLLAVILISADPCASSTLVEMENDGVTIVFPPGEQRIAARIYHQLAPIMAFLNQKGLPIQRPLHVFVDPDLDEPDVRVHVIPHREIRIPLRAPGVFEDGYTESDPWTYFLFKGLCRQGIYGLRSGIPGLLHRGFGEIISPNVVLPPWIEEGICSLLYMLFSGKPIQDPFEAALFQASPPPDLELISNHPEIWPGYFAHRIYGKPFLLHLYQEYGWSVILEFLEIHGKGVIPIEIDWKAQRVFGKTVAALWNDFQMRFDTPPLSPPGILLNGYWADPFVYWNRAGVFPGKLQIRQRGRYGFVDSRGVLWLAEFNGSAKLTNFEGGRIVYTSSTHIWDPGPGGVAVTRIGSRPHLILFDDGDSMDLDGMGNVDDQSLVPAPEGVLQLSGPVRNAHGAVAVAANTGGNWDIWVYDQEWVRITDQPSIECDPWWEGDSPVYASNATGRFQIHADDRDPITAVDKMALLPRQGKFARLTANGWQLGNYKTDRLTFGSSVLVPKTPTIEEAAHSVPESSPYSPLKSLWPNYIKPDLYAGVSDLQIGLASKSRDVSGEYRMDAGLRYLFDTDYLALRLGAQAQQMGAQFTRYPLSYTTDADQSVDESRHEIRFFWRPVELEDFEPESLLRPSEGVERFEGIELSLNQRFWDPLGTDDRVASGPPSGDETWLGIGVVRQVDLLRLWGSLELFSKDRQSATLGGRMLFGDQTLTSLHLMLGRAWGDTPAIGHTHFRIGGDVSEGYFTRLPPKSFPVRGFSANLIEAPKAAAGGIEIFWPLANLQVGYASLPLFLHRLRLGTFIDAGIAGETFRSEDVLVGAGVELVTSLEIAWGGFSSFRMGVAWPLRYPGYVQDTGPKFVIQLGRPL